MTTLTTPRLLLRPWCIFDTPDLFDYASDPAVADMAGWPVYTSVDQAREFIEGTLIPKQSFAIELCETGKVIGNIALLNTVFSRAFTSLEAREVAFSLSH
ncbi:MAG: GNAT family N-acetyltransferase, partial [Oscillospiraceae bacterium]